LIKRQHLLKTILILFATACSVLAGSACRADDVLDFNHHFDGFMGSVREATTPENILMASGFVMLIGGEQERTTVQACLKAAIVAELAVGSLKCATNRQRPAGSHSRWNSSFPSSHAAASFAFATCVSRAHPRLSIPSYTLAGIVAFSRVYHRRHHMPDVIAGALIGVAAARLTEERLPHLRVDFGGLRPRTGARVDRGDGGDTVYRMYLSADF
jgi:undecaprenyl-diphosphatase